MDAVYTVIDNNAVLHFATSSESAAYKTAMERMEMLHTPMRIAIWKGAHLIGAIDAGDIARRMIVDGEVAID